MTQKWKAEALDPNTYKQPRARVVLELTGAAARIGNQDAFMRLRPPSQVVQKEIGQCPHSCRADSPLPPHGLRPSPCSPVVEMRAPTHASRSSGASIGRVCMGSVGTVWMDSLPSRFLRDEERTVSAVTRSRGSVRLE